MISFYTLTKLNMAMKPKSRVGKAVSKVKAVKTRYKAAYAKGENTPFVKKQKKMIKLGYRP